MNQPENTGGGKPRSQSVGTDDTLTSLPKPTLSTVEKVDSITVAPKDVESARTATNSDDERYHATITAGEALAQIQSHAPSITFPEGGLEAWLVVLGSFCAMSSVFGLINSAAVFESYFSTYQLEQHSPSEIGWIFSLYLFIVFFVGIQVGPVFDRRGARGLVAAGSLAVVASLFFLAQCETYYQIILTYSVMGGIGGALLNPPAYGCIAHFFNERRGIATGIATTAGGIGGIVYPLLLQHILPKLGFAWSCRVLGFIMLGLAVPANLFLKTRLPPAPKRSKVRSLLPAVDIFRDTRFVLSSLGIFFMEWGLFIPLTFIISYAADHGQDANESYVLLSFLNAGSVVGRVLPGFMADRFGRFNTVIATISLCVVTVLGLWLPAGHSKPMLIAYSVVFGFASGSNLGLTPVCLGQLFDHRNFGRYFSTAMMVASFGTLSSVPIGGALLGIGSGETGWRATKMANEPSVAPALSTPADHLFEHVEPISETRTQRLPDDELRNIYEITRTAREIRDGGWTRVGLQFPDTMLTDAPWVAETLGAELASPGGQNGGSGNESGAANKQPRIYILADTSYSSCCVDEIAAEHVDADVVVHYGRSCLSPTSRLPVIYVFTRHELDHAATVEAFEKEYADKQEKVILMADVTYQDHVQDIATQLQARGYAHLLSTSIVHDPTGRIPNRKMVWPDSSDALCGAEELKDFSIFHISDPPTALLLALSSRVRSLHIHPTNASSSDSSPPTQRLLGRRYARCLSLATAGVIGILVNTLSVQNYLASIDSIRKQIAAKGKKSYTVVVGKLNPAKLANFAEVDGWVVVGCWESSLVEDDSSYFKPVITPFELDIALAGDESRVWTGEWWGGIEGVKEFKDGAEKKNNDEQATLTLNGEDGLGDEDDQEESEPPEFDLRTGRLISHSRPMRLAANKTPSGQTAVSSDSVKESTADESWSGTLALRPKTELATVNGVVSPGAEYLRSQRTWQGLGSDFDNQASTVIEEGRSGVARGYTVGEDAGRT
ncbi:Major facilitator superfamily domain containing protein [Rhypophila decipiens]